MIMLLQTNEVESLNSVSYDIICTINALHGM